jgi:outer membrane protein assembly factor BamE
MRPLFILCIAACLSACGFIGFPGVYKIDVEQGNIVTEEMVAQLKPGMSRRQVRFILGTPLLEDPFNQERWDYPYSKRNGLKLLDEARLSVYFEGDSLVRYEGDVQEAYGSPKTFEENSGDSDSDDPDGS